MPGSHWMIVLNNENFEITRQRQFTLQGVKSRHRKKAERMAPGDRMLFYVAGLRAFPATATVTSTYFEDPAPVWKSEERRPEAFQWRVRIKPDCVLESYEYIDGQDIAPRMMYVKRWPPEQWALAFQGNVHLLSSADFTLIENEMSRIIRRRGSRREQAPRRLAPAGAS